MDSTKESVRRQFSQNAADYRDAPLFSAGQDLRQMVASVPLNGRERVLDIGTGAGHTALAFAAVAGECVGLDLTDAMIDVATKFAAERGVTNVHFEVGDAEDLPFPNESFDVVSCRFAAHHFGHVERSIEEIARVLRPGGTFILVDHLAPEDDLLDGFVNHLDRLRDPSHVREHRGSEYQSMFAQHGLSYAQHGNWDLGLDFQDWVQRGRTSTEVVTQLVKHLQNAPQVCKEVFRVEFDPDRQPVSFCLKCALIHGVKQGSR